MNNKDFRIGNLLVDSLTGAYLEVCELGENVGATVIDRSRYPLPDGWQMAPIPITSIILQKFGFQKDRDGVFKRGNVMYWVADTWPGGDVLQIAAGYAPIINCPCKYVHQLQNLIYALTGEEINIEL